MENSYLKKQIILYGLLTLSCFQLNAQTSRIIGLVSSTGYRPLADVIVGVKGTEITAVTDSTGGFTIAASRGESLIFSLTGYSTREVVVGRDDDIRLTLATNDLKGTEAYHSLFSSQRKDFATASFSEVYEPQLSKTNSPFIGGLLSGRLAGLNVSQSSGEPGYNAFTLSLRGQAPLILIDGIPQGLTSLNPEQIESVTVLKDAVSTAMLGVRGAGGAVLITTKKGDAGQHIKFKALRGVQQPVKLPQFLSAYDYASLYNEALANDGKAPLYSQGDLDAYQNGSDPIGHPNVDWQNEVLKDQAAFERYDLAVSGAGDIASYFVNLDYLNQQGLFKTDATNPYNTNADFKRYTLRSNIAVDLTEYLSTRLNLFGQVQDLNEPGASTTSIFRNFLNTPNNAHPVVNPDGSLAGNQDYQSNPYGQVLHSGYRPSTVNDFKADLSITGKLDNWLPGLWVKGTGSFRNNVRENINRSKSRILYLYTGEDNYLQFGNTTDQSNSRNINFRERQFYAELSAGYSNRVGRHGVESILLANYDNLSVGNLLPQNFSGISGRVSYDFDRKYLAEINFGYQGMNRYPESSRYGLFPAIGLGWMVSEESFMDQTAEWLETLKVRASYGRTGNANIGYYIYNQYYESGNAYNFGNSPTNAPGVIESVLANPEVTWEKADKLNVGVDAVLLKGRLSATLDYFNNRFFDLLQLRGESSELLGGAFPQENLGVSRYSGGEFELVYQHNIAGFHYFIAPNISLLKTKVIFQDEVAQPFSWMRRTGQPVGQPFGYVAEGLFQTQEEINSSPVPSGYDPVPGDIKYRDLNEDGVIDAFDQTTIGNKKPLIYYGANLGFEVGGFDFSMLIQGAENRVMPMTGNAEWEFQNHGRAQAYLHHLERWTPETATSATYPRLSIGKNINNHQLSSYWIRSGDFLRLKNIELGYTLPFGMSRRVGLDVVRVFMNGTNLFTQSELDRIDPESSWGVYPIQRFLNFGVNINL